MTPLGFRVQLTWGQVYGPFIGQKIRRRSELYLLDRTEKDSAFMMEKRLIERARDAAFGYGLFGGALCPTASSVSIALDSIEMDEFGGAAAAVSKL